LEKRYYSVALHGITANTEKVPFLFSEAASLASPMMAIFQKQCHPPPITHDDLD
jgi:hypothetical protein